MMKKIIYLILFLSLVSNFAVSKDNDIKVSFSSGIGNYSLESLKIYVNNYNTDFFYNNKFHLSETGGFPPFYYFSGEVKKEFFENIFFGITYSYISTGTRLSAGNSNVSYYTDFLVNANIIGISYQSDFPVFSDFHLKPFSTFDFIFSNLDVKENAQSTQKTTTNEINMTTNSNGVSIGSDFVYSFWNLSVGLRLYYYYEHSIFFNREFDDSSDEVNDVIQSDWKGFRVGMIFEYSLPF
jgi:hypothetical protein